MLSVMGKRIRFTVVMDEDVRRAAKVEAAKRDLGLSEFMEKTLSESVRDTLNEIRQQPSESKPKKPKS